MQLKEFIYEEVDNKPIVIYGATVGGKIIYQCLRNKGIEVSFFIDRDTKKREWCGLPVKSPSALKNDKCYMVLIALTRSFVSAYNFMEEIGYEKVYSCSELIKDKKIQDFEYSENEKIVVGDFLNKYPIYAENLKENEIVLPALEVFVTERCTLRCRDCSHLIPRYENPRDYEVDDIIEHIENVLKIVKKISDLIVLGGEPLLYKRLPKLLEFCYSQKKIETITIVSNGTVMPNENFFKVMHKTGARLRLSNYGKYSTRLNELKFICKKENIECFINDELWTDMGEIYDHNYTERELKDVFSDCPFAYAILLLKGRIFRCPHIAHLNNLKVIDSYHHDCVDIRNINAGNIEIKKKELSTYLNIPYLLGCSYCNGIKNSIQGIEPAIQGIR